MVRKIKIWIGLLFQYIGFYNLLMKKLFKNKYLRFPIKIMLFIPFTIIFYALFKLIIEAITRIIQKYKPETK